MNAFSITTTKTFTPKWVHHHFSTFNEKWRAIRNTMQYKANSCFKCNKKFDENESIALVCLGEVGNKVFCELCASEVEK